jgi:hypothetical protein
VFTESLLSNGSTCYNNNNNNNNNKPIINLVKDENGDLLADSQNILIRCKNDFSQLLKVHRVSDVRQIEIRTYS